MLQWLGHEGLGGGGSLKNATTPYGPVQFGIDCEWKPGTATLLVLINRDWVEHPEDGRWSPDVRSFHQWTAFEDFATIEDAMAFAEIVASELLTPAERHALRLCQRSLQPA